MVLVILCPSSDAEKIRRKISQFASYDWERRGRIRLFEVAAEEGADRLINYCGEHRATDILVPHRVHCDIEALSESDFRVTHGKSIKVLLSGGGLRTELEHWRLDWRNEVSERLAHFGLAKLGIGEIEAWLRQFDSLGDYRDVGVHLLQLVDVLPQSDLAESLSAGLDFFKGELIVGFNQDKWGKSWGTVSNLVAKRSMNANILPIGEAITWAARPESTTRLTHLVEDGLFSATETIGVFDSLLGERAEGRRLKVPPLADPKILDRIQAQLHFAFVSDYGEERLRHYFTRKQLNIQVTVQGAARRVNVLRQAEGTSLPYTSSVHDYRDGLMLRIDPYAFQPGRGWQEETLTKARRFCQLVGEQLWSHYLTNAGRAGSSWPIDRIRRCALGMDGLGLTFAFPHSVPKASLPLLWASGKVTVDGRQTQWSPLFPNAGI